MRRALSALVFSGLGFGLGLLYPIAVRPPLIVDQDAVVAGAEGQAVVTIRTDAGRYLDIAPHGPADTLLILYPGGLVRPQAYQWLGMALAPLGVRTVIPEFPFDLAVISPHRAEALMARLPANRVILAGHSLGGAMAARFAARHPDRLDGLVLMAAYSAAGDDLSGQALPVLVLAAEHDGLATVATIASGLERLPPTTRLEVIAGAVHSFFGRYGPQRGDGLPTVTREAAEAAIIAALRAFLLAP